MDLPKLPPGSAYTNKQGQANVKVRAENDTIYVEATCDEITAHLERMEREISHIRELAETKQEEKEPPSTGIKTIIKWFLSGVLTGGIIAIIVIRKIRK